MQYGQQTKIRLYQNKATGVSSSIYGSNVDSLAFNIGFIVFRDPHLAVKIMELYEEALKIQEDHSVASEEDFKSAQIKFDRVLKKVFSNKKSKL